MQKSGVNPANVELSESSLPPAPPGYSVAGSSVASSVGATPVVIVSGQPMPPAQHSGGEIPTTVAASDGAASQGVAAPIERVEEVAASAEQPRSGAEPRSARLSVLAAEPTPKELRATLSRLGLVGCCGSLCGVGVQAALAQLRHALELDGSLRLRSEGDVRVVAYLLRHVCSSLATLCLTSNQIGHEGAKALAAGVAASGSLAKLNLAWNQIGDVGAKAIAEALKSSGSLVTLDLNSNRIGNEGAKAIAEALVSSGSLATLVLSHNTIGNEGAKALAEVLASSGSLATLNLYGCGIGDEGAKALAAGVASSGSMAALNLDWNPNIGYAARQSLRDAVQGRQGFDLRVYHSEW